MHVGGRTITIIHSTRVRTHRKSASSACHRRFVGLLGIAAVSFYQHRRTIMFYQHAIECSAINERECSFVVLRDKTLANGHPRGLITKGRRAVDGKQEFYNDLLLVLNILGTWQESEMIHWHNYYIDIILEFCILVRRFYKTF